MDGGLDVVGVGIALWCAVAAAVSYAETVKLLGSAAEVKTGDGSVAAIGEASTGFIPPKMGGSPVVFTPPGTPSNTVPAKGDAQFEPHLDAVEFPNPSSIALVRAPNIEKKNVSGGTCLGISYLTSIYYYMSGVKLRGMDLRTCDIEGVKAGLVELAGAVIDGTQAAQICANLGMTVKFSDP